MFVWDKGALNEEQEEAITEPDNVLLIACPGSGKTRTLSYKIAYELSRLPSERHFIVAITYTNIAADEIKERVELLGADTSRLWIGTIHAFCLEWILRPYSLYLDDLKTGFRILNSHESEELITGFCKTVAGGRITYFDCPFVARLKGYVITSLDTHKHIDIKAVLDKYFKTLRENNQIDFEQILYYSHKLLQEHSVISVVLSKIFSVILIDEYQDTKLIQYHIIAMILKAGKGATKTLIVGDPNQSIYDSLGGYPMPKSELEGLLGFSLKEMSLSKNYRSSQKIIDYFDYYKTYTNTIVCSGSDKDYPSRITFNNTVQNADLIDEIARLILYNATTLSISPNEICIVAPFWIHLASLTRSLMIKLPDYSFDGPGMAPFARDIDNFWYKLSRIILTEPSPNLYVKRLRWSKEILDDLTHAGVHLPDVTPKLFLKLCNSLLIDEANGLVYLEKAFDEIAVSLSITVANFPSLQEHHKSFFASAVVRITRLKSEGNEFIDTIENFRKVFKQRQGITVSTIHGVKGAEYDTMIGFALLEDYIPHFSDPRGQENAKKLLYVLSSRARKNLHLISERGRGRGRFTKDTTKQLQSYNYTYDTV